MYTNLCISILIGSQIYWSDESMCGLSLYVPDISTLANFDDKLFIAGLWWFRNHRRISVGQGNWRTEEGSGGIDKNYAR